MKLNVSVGGGGHSLDLSVPNRLCQPLPRVGVARSASDGGVRVGLAINDYAYADRILDCRKLFRCPQCKPTMNIKIVTETHMIYYHSLYRNIDNDSDNDDHNIYPCT